MCQQQECQKSKAYLKEIKKFSGMWFNDYYEQLQCCDCASCEQDVEWLFDIADRKSDCEEEPQTECSKDNMCSVNGEQCEYCDWEVECGDCEDAESDLHNAIKERLNGNTQKTNF